jgi:hypothetical protein
MGTKICSSIAFLSAPLSAVHRKSLKVCGAACPTGFAVLPLTPKLAPTSLAVYSQFENSASIMYCVRSSQNASIYVMCNVMLSPAILNTVLVRSMLALCVGGHRRYQPVSPSFDASAAKS